MLKVISVLATLFVTSFACAQTKPYVEVIVQDTMQLDPEEIIYAVSRADWYTADTAGIDTIGGIGESIEPAVDRLKEVRQLIQAMQLDTLKEPMYAFSSNENFQQPAILVRFYSIYKLNEFTKRVRTIKDIRGAITSSRTSQEMTAEKVLFQRLFNQAKAKAETLAHVAGKKLGTVVFVKEKEQQGGWTMYPPLSTIPGWHTEVSTEQTGKITLYRGLIVQFSWQ